MITIYIYRLKPIEKGYHLIIMPPIIHRENGGTPCIMWVFIGSQSPFKGLLGGVKQLEALHPKGSTIFPMTYSWFSGKL